jgi:putative ABC transport system substrate-binding protein
MEGTSRRSFVARVGALSLTAIGLPAWSQGRQLRVGYLSFRPGPNEFEQAFLRGLRERGLVEGRNVNVDFRWAAFDQQHYRNMAAELVALNPTVLVVADSVSFLPMIRELAPVLPIVVPIMADPIAQHLTKSIARPDGNVTGVTALSIELSHKRLQLLKEAIPSLTRVAALYNRIRPASPLTAATIDAGKALGVEVVEMPVALPDGIDNAFAAAVRDRIGGVIIVSDTATITYRQQLGSLALRHKLPTIFANRTYLKGGGLMSYGPDLEAAFERSAYFVERILRGAAAADLPIEQPTTFQLALNERTARALGVHFPQAMVARADLTID